MNNEELRSKITQALELAESYFKEALIELFKKYSNVQAITIRINNHEFNDGDATFFSLNYDDIAMDFKEVEEGEEADIDYSNASENQRKVLKEFADLFEDCDVAFLYESLFGDEHESVTIEFKEGLVY